MKLKVGDRIKLKRGFSECSRCGVNSPFRGEEYIGKEGTICKINSVYGNPYYVDFGEAVRGGHNCDGCCAFACGQRFCEEHLELISTKKSIMFKLNSMMKRLLDADIKKLIKGGLINGDLQLTEEGKETLMSIIFEGNKAELVKVAEENIKEAEKK